MILISHRGNITGENRAYENSPGYILDAIKKGYDVEVDVRLKSGRWYLGHDEPEYNIDDKFLKNDKLWCHAKNIEALYGLLNLGVKCFWHQTDKFTLTSNGFIWTYPGFEVTNKSICVMPEMRAKIYQNFDKCAGICSDKIEEYRGIND